MSARGPGRILCLGQRVGIDDLERPFIYIGEVVPVKRLAAVRTEAFADVIVDIVIAADVYTPAALHPKYRLDETADIIPIRFEPVRCTVQERANRCHLTAAALHGNADGLFRRCKKGVIELIEREKAAVKLWKILNVCFNSKIVRAAHPPNTEYLPVCQASQGYYIMAFHGCH